MPRPTSKPALSERPRGFTPDDRARDVVREFVGRYQFLHEWRIQKIVFYADMLSLERRGYRLTDLPFRRHHYGVYSDEIKGILKSMEELEREPARTPTGRRTLKFSLHSTFASPTLDRQDLALIEEAHEATRDLTNEQLADWGKETSLWRDTPQGELLNFEQYARSVGRTSKEWIERYQADRAGTETQKARYRSANELRRAIAEQEKS